MRAMTAAEMVKVYVANNEARRNQAIIDSVYAPELKAAIANYARTAMSAFKVSEQWKTQLAEIAANQPKMQFPKIEIPQSLLEQMGKQIQLQNQDLIKIAKKHVALFGGIKFQLPEGYLEAAAAWREQLADEAAADDPYVAGERLRKLAREREAIIKCL
jgi:RNA-binding protein YhbY